ncbi:MAG: hypothetical protein J7647_17935 [Cyanobacteria bacterium SBLK]|nr:hypothetical protein [Cyanobacteria bacterium SBLK]
MRIGKWFGRAIALLWAVLLLGSCGGREAMRWQSAESYFDRPVLEEIIEDNSTVPISRLEGRVRVSEMVSNPRLVWVDFNTEGMCGRLGCAYVVYGESEEGWKRLWMQYLDPHLPPDVPLVSRSSTKPVWASFCLDINQLEGETALRRMQVCWDGKEMRKVEQKRIRLDDF